MVKGMAKMKTSVLLDEGTRLKLTTLASITGKDMTEIITKGISLLFEYTKECYREKEGEDGETYQVLLLTEKLSEGKGRAKLSMDEIFEYAVGKARERAKEDVKGEEVK
ncbi:hypothetical protein DRP05_13935 [Archaeoglobales archaeon]|nr:MAG: hypothetical protein DRP05_13935 [Archaeoglobales archaeon]